MFVLNPFNPNVPNSWSCDVRRFVHLRSRRQISGTVCGRCLKPPFRPRPHPVVHGEKQGVNRNDIVKTGIVHIRTPSDYEYVQQDGDRKNHVRRGDVFKVQLGSRLGRGPRSVGQSNTAVSTSR